MKHKRSKKTDSTKPRTETEPTSAQPRSPTKSTHPHAHPHAHPQAHPHDHLFKEIFSTKEAQQDLVRMALPPEITSHFHMKTIRDAGQETTTGRVDLLLTVETVDNTTEHVYVLVEHKSYRDPETWTAPTELTGLHRAVESTGTDGSPMQAPPDDVGFPPHHTPPGGYPVNLRYHLFDLDKIPPQHIAERAGTGLRRAHSIQVRLEAPG